MRAREHRLRMKSTNMLERYNEELRRRTRVVRIFPNAESCLRPILALAAETHERWLMGQRYLYGRVSAPTGNCRKFLTQLEENLRNLRKGVGRLVDWVEDHVEETLTVYRLSREHRPRMKSTNMLERYNEELRRRTRVIRIFPNAESCLRLILALATETHERWLTGSVIYMAGSPLPLVGYQF